MSQTAARSLRAEAEWTPTRERERPRRTIAISGQAVPAPPVPTRRAAGATSAPSRRRPPARARQTGARPDRVAMWAVILGFALVLAAATSSHAAPPAHAPAVAAHVAGR